MTPGHRPAALRWALAAMALLVASAVAAQQRTGAPQPAPPASAEASVLRIAVLADLNERYGDQFHRETVHRAVERVRELAPDLVLVAGDMVAGQRPGLDYRGMWEAFHTAVTRPLEGLPLAIAPGNHDASAYERYAEERVVYEQEWADPETLERFEGIAIVDASHFPFRYAFTLGPALFVALDATTRNALDDAQLDWLEGVLTRTDPAEYPVRVLFGHVPPYPLAQGRERDHLLGDPDRRARFELLMAEHGVAAYISGHHHAYYPGRHPGTGMLLIGAGCLGGGPRVLLGEDRVIEDQDDPTERILVLIEIDRSGVRSVDGFRGPDFGPSDRVDPSALPDRIGLDDMPIERADL